MKNVIGLTQEEANGILNILTELPIKYLNHVQVIKTFFEQKFAAPEPEEHRPALDTTLTRNGTGAQDHRIVQQAPIEDGEMP